MKRTHSENCREENDEDLTLKLSAEKPKIDVVEKTTGVEDITTESYNASSATPSDDKCLHRTHGDKGKISLCTYYKTFFL